MINYKFNENDLLHWPFRDAYLIEILNGEYTVEEAKEDLLSLITRETKLNEHKSKCSNT